MLDQKPASIAYLRDQRVHDPRREGAGVGEEAGSGITSTMPTFQDRSSSRLILLAFGHVQELLSSR